MKRFLIACAVFVASVVPSFAQLTPAPYVLQQYFDNTGLVLSSGGMCIFRAGTSTLATTYTTAAGTVANANPLLFNSAGRPSSNGFFLTPGSAYKLVLKDFTGVSVPTCIPDTGTTIWTQDNIRAVPGSAGAVDIDGTAGVSFTAGEVAYLSNGSGSLNAGQWYKADADLSYAGALPIVGFAVNNVSAAASGSFRISGLLTDLSGLSGGSDYYVSATAGGITVTPPLMARYVGRAQSPTSLVVNPNPRSTVTTPRAPCGRLTLTTGVPVTTADVTAAATLYYTPYGGCTSMTLYDGSVWYQTDFAQISIATPAVANQLYDVFVYDNAGTPTLELTAWTNDTTRATALATQNGVYVKTGALTRLYLGSVRTVTASQFNDSAALRHVYNYYNRVARFLQKLETTDSWSYTSQTIRQANNSTANQVDLVVGVAEESLTLTVSTSVEAAAAVTFRIGIGEDSVTAYDATIGPTSWLSASLLPTGMVNTLIKVPAAGRHYYAWLEAGDNASATTVGGDWSNAATWGTAGLRGWIRQ